MACTLIMFATNSVLQKVATVLFSLHISLINTKYLRNAANTACIENKNETFVSQL